MYQIAKGYHRDSLVLITHETEHNNNNNNNNNNNRKKRNRNKKKKAKVIPVVTEATGTISKSLIQYLNNITGNTENYGTSNKSHIGNCTRTIESVNVKVQNIFHGRNNCTCSTNC